MGCPLLPGRRIRTRPPRLLSCRVSRSSNWRTSRSIRSTARRCYTQKVTEAPSSVTIVTADEIKRYGYRTLADILRSVRGFYVTYDRNYSYLGVRGFSRPGDYNARILLLVDGHRLNDNIFGAALIGTEFPLDIDLIERVEIIRGPSSSLYGTSAFFAVINVISETLRYHEGPGGRGIARQSSTREKAGSPSAANSIAASSPRVSLDVRKRRRASGSSFRSSTARRPTTALRKTRTRTGSAKFFGRVDVRRTSRCKALYGAREKAIPTASFGTVFNDPRSQTIERQGFVDLQYDRTIANTGRSARGSMTTGTATTGTTYSTIQKRDVPSWSSTRISRVATGGARSSNSTGSCSSGHTLAVGSEYRNNFRQDQFNYDQEPFLEYLDDRRTSTNWALYVQDEIALHRTLILNVGPASRSLRHVRRHDESHGPG